MACVLPSCRESQKRLDQPCVYGDLKGTYRVDYAGPVDVVAVPNSRHAGGSYVQLGELCSCQVVCELTSRSVRAKCRAGFARFASLPLYAGGRRSALAVLFSALDRDQHGIHA